MSVVSAIESRAMEVIPSDGIEDVSFVEVDPNAEDVVVAIFVAVCVL